MFEGVKTWIDIVIYFIEKTRIKLGNMKVEANWWNVLNSERDVKIKAATLIEKLVF